MHLVGRDAVAHVDPAAAGGRVKTSTRDVPRHLYVEDPDTPGTCVTCHTADPKATNRRHQLPDLSSETRESRRRAGIDDEDDDP